MPYVREPGFHLNRGTIARILKTDKGLGGAVHAAAEGMVSTIPGAAFVRDYVTDRQATAVVVRAEDQARDGAATRAATRYATQNRAAVRAMRVADGGAQTQRASGRARSRRRNAR